MLNACGVWLVGLGLYFIVLRQPLLPEDLRFMGTTLEQIRIAVPGLESWLSKVFRVMGGFMAGAGVFTVFVATEATPSQSKAVSWALALSGVLTVTTLITAQIDPPLRGRGLRQKTASGRCKSRLSQL